MAYTHDTPQQVHSNEQGETILQHERDIAGVMSPIMKLMKIAYWEKLCDNLGTKWNVIIAEEADANEVLISSTQWFY